MRDDLKLLLDLQEIDYRLLRIEQSKTEFPLKLRDLQNQIERVQASRQNALGKMNSLQAEKKKLENEVLQERELLAKSQGRLNTIKTNKEYDAVHEEITVHQNRINTAEERILGLLEAQETAKKVDEEAQNQEKAVVDKNTPEIENLSSKTSEIDEQIKEVQKSRDALASQLPQRILRMYDRILKGRPTRQVIGAVTPERRSCSFCFKSLTLQQVNEVRRNDDVIACDGCGSILIWTEQENGKN